MVAVEVGLTVYVGVVRPHMNFYQYIRQLANTCITCIILIIYAAYGQASKDFKSPVKPTFYLPIVILVLLLIVLLGNLAFIVKHIVTENVIPWV